MTFVVQNSAQSSNKRKNSEDNFDSSKKAKIVENKQVI